MPSWLTPDDTPLPLEPPSRVESAPLVDLEKTVIAGPKSLDDSSAPLPLEPPLPGLEPHEVELQRAANANADSFASTLAEPAYRESSEPDWEETSDASLEAEQVHPETPLSGDSSAPLPLEPSKPPPSLSHSRRSSPDEIAAVGAIVEDIAEEPLPMPGSNTEETTVSFAQAPAVAKVPAKSPDDTATGDDVRKPIAPVDSKPIGQVINAQPVNNQIDMSAPVDLFAEMAAQSAAGTSAVGASGTGMDACIETSYRAEMMGQLPDVSLMPWDLVSVTEARDGIVFAFKDTDPNVVKAEIHKFFNEREYKLEPGDPGTALYAKGGGKGLIKKFGLGKRMAFTTAIVVRRDQTLFAIRKAVDSSAASEEMGRLVAVLRMIFS